VRGAIIGLALLGIVVFGALSLRPGGIRNQLRNIARRLKLALILGGIYMIISAGLRIALPDTAVAEWAPIGVGAVLALVFVAMSAERPLERR
jgi:hypothetical protein